jgi:TonB family protein
MNKVKKLAVLAALLGVSGLIAGAATNEQSYMKAYEGRSDVPVPVYVTAPQVPTSQAGHVEVQLVVNEMGRPTQIRVRSASDELLVDPVLAAVSHWRFAPVIEDGKPVAKKIMIPFQIVTADGARTLASSN